MGTLIKICGITNEKDAVIAEKHGADYIGVLVDVPVSPRSVTLQDANVIFEAVNIPKVALVWQKTLQELSIIISELRPCAIQFVTECDPKVLLSLKEKYPHVQLWQSLHMPADESADETKIYKKASKLLAQGIEVLLLDTLVYAGQTAQFGGTGRTGNWPLAAKIVSELDIPIFLAGGLNPENVAEAITVVKPAGVDVSSGVEIKKGQKDPEKIKNFINSVRFYIG